MNIFRHFCTVFFLFTSLLYAIDFSKNDSFQPLLLHSSLYIDHTCKMGIESVEDKVFTPIEKNSIGFGYVPDFDVWVKIELHNSSSQKIKKIIEYANPLTTNIHLYDIETKKLLFMGGTSVSSPLKSINPAFPITLLPQEHKTYYLKASSDVTTLIVSLNLWDVDAFYQKESKHQFILALFFGAMGIIILYNFIIYLSVRERVYLYYVLGFAGIVLHHLFYTGLAGLYFFTPEETLSIVKYASFIVAVPAFFLALFTKNILKLEEYPRLLKFLNMYLIFFVFITFFIYYFEINYLRNIFSVILLLVLFGITFYALIRHNRQAKFIMLGWVALMSSGLLMYFSSIGYYDVFHKFPYYVEISLLIETLLFSLILADRLKQLRNDKITSQKYLIDYQKQEESRLTRVVEEKTSQLQCALKEKDLLLQELNHRVKNSIQTIVSFLRLQIDETNNPKMKQSLMHIENRIMSISHLYSLLYAKHNHSYISTYEYFSLILEHIQKTLDKKEVKIKLETKVDLHSETAVYCGFIINEAVTNALQHAFVENINPTITISFLKKNQYYTLSIKDNGKGFDNSIVHESLGLLIIESLATYQLQGVLEIIVSKGTQLMVKWEDKNG